MRDQVKDFVIIVTEILNMPEPIYEFGSYLVPEQIETANIRYLFPGKEYVGCDMREGPGVDRILNLHSIELEESTVGTVLCLDTLEHVEYPNKALEEIHRILKPNGVVIISSCMNYPIHDFPCDYWRFTPEAFRSILKSFRNIYVNYAGQNIFPHTIVGVGCKGPDTDFEILALKGDDWRRKWTEPESPKTFAGKLKRETKRIYHQISRIFKTN
jgi:SAM-dependent methyltransferase